jgi:hypothetical protein
LWTGPSPSRPAFPQGASSAYPGQAGAPPSSAATPYGGQFPPHGYVPYASYGGPHVKQNNGLAIASLVCSCAGFVLLIPAVLGIIFGFVARSQIGRSGGTQSGEGLALAGIIVGFGWIALFVIVGIVNASHHTNGAVALSLFINLPSITA